MKVATFNVENMFRARSRPQPGRLERRQAGPRSVFGLDATAGAARLRRCRQKPHPRTAGKAGAPELRGERQRQESEVQRSQRVGLAAPLPRSPRLQAPRRHARGRRRGRGDWIGWLELYRGGQRDRRPGRPRGDHGRRRRHPGGGRGRGPAGAGALQRRAHRAGAFRTRDADRRQRRARHRRRPHDPRGLPDRSACAATSTPPTDRQPLFSRDCAEYEVEIGRPRRCW